MTFRRMTLAAIIVLGCAAPAWATYSLVWSDEFDGTSLDTSNWTADIGDGCPNLCGWGNNELQYYRAENVTVSDGNLVLTSREEYYGGRSYTSGKVHTRDKRSFLYGRIEMRAMIPTGDGMWPAFWMMPQDDVYGGWAASGEIDIMESSNATTSVGGTLHFGGSWPDNTYTGGSYSLGGGTSFADDFHIYAVEWEADEIRWYVDDVLFSTKVSSQWYSDGAPSNPRAPFDQEFYIILNAAVGGNYTGCTDTWCIDADLPQQYIIDYVRVYADIDNFAPTVEITAPTDVELPAGDITIEADAEDQDGTVATVEFYVGETYLGEDTTAPYSFVWSSVPDGCYSIVVKAIDDLGASGEDSIDVTVGTGCGQAPYSGSPVVLPARVEVEDFDVGGEGVAYHDTGAANNGSQYRPAEGVDIETCSDTGGGYGVGWIEPGEWLEYTVTVPAAGEYPIDVRVASLSDGGTFRILFDGVDRTGDVTVPVTTGWQTWETVSTTAVLAAGRQTMRFVAATDGFNVNYIEIQEGATAAPPALATAGCVLHPCRPNPFNPSTTISYELAEPGAVRLTVHDVAGRRIRTLVAGETVGAGRHDIVWNGRDETGRAVATGVYYCRLEAGGRVDTRRMALVK